MADASSCDTTSDCYNESLSEMFSERNTCVIIGQKPEFPYYHKNKHNFVDKLFTREIRGSTAIHNYAPEERLITFIPSWRRLSLSHIIPKSALKAGHIIMGLTQCGQFLLTYTYSWEVGSDLYKYLLHWWAFTPNQVARKVAEVSLFGNYTIYRELSISVAQWPMERNKLVIHGLCVMMPTSAQIQRVDRAYLTITTVPSLDNCRDCLKVASSCEEEELAANWDSGVRYNCLQHGLTVHTTYEIISPYPRFQPKVCLNYSNHVVVNTGNFLQVFKVELETAKMRNTSSNCNKNSNEKTEFCDDERVLDMFEPECYENVDDKLELASPKCYSSAGSDIVDEQSSSRTLDTSDQVSSSIYGSSQSVHCDINRLSSDSLTSACNCDNVKSSQKDGTNLASSIRDEILQDFCEELNIANDSIMLVKHPLSMPHRLPVDLKTQSWLFHSLMPQSSPEPDNTLQEQRNNSICSQDSIATSVNISSINSLHNLTLSPTPSSSPRLMSPPVSTSFRHLTTPRRRSSLQSNQQIRNRPSQEAEKAYEFTDDSQEITCEKLSSFRKRRLADKKYEFCDETEDAENIVPFKHIRDQSKYHDCSLLHQITSPTTSPVMSAIRRHSRLDSDHHSENEDCNSSQDSNMTVEPEPAEKSVLRPLNQNQLSKGNVYRDRTYKNSSPLVPKLQFLQYPSIKCTAHYKRSYIELDDEMISVITEVEDEETGGYVSYQYVLPMVVHGSGYTQMQMISNSKAEKMVVPCVCINQLSFDIEMFSHHIADWICKQFNKKYWHCSDYDIEIIQICALSGDIICLLMLKIQASEGCGQNQSSQERKQYEVGCEFTWNIETSEYRITRVLPINELKAKSLMQVFVETLNNESVQKPWNPTSSIALSLRQKIRQPYTRMVRYLETEMTLSADSIVNLIDMDNLVELYVSADYD